MLNNTLSDPSTPGDLFRPLGGGGGVLALSLLLLLLGWTTRPRPERSQDIVERRSCPSFRRSPLEGHDQLCQTAHPSSLAEALGQRPLRLLAPGRTSGSPIRGPRWGLRRTSRRSIPTTLAPTESTTERGVRKFGREGAPRRGPLPFGCARGLPAQRYLRGVGGPEGGGGATQGVHTPPTALMPTHSTLDFN